MKEAADTFVATLADGTDRLVVKGQPFPDGHELVKRDQNPETGSGNLFRDVDYGEESPKSAEAPAAQAPLKPGARAAVAAAKGKAP